MRAGAYGDDVLRPPSPRLAIAALVLAGLGAAVVLALFSPMPSRLPGVALGSHAVLSVERAVAVFAAWMLVLMVVAQALRGELPAEVSGRGIRYADAEVTRRAVGDLRRAVEKIEGELGDTRGAVLDRRQG